MPPQVEFRRKQRSTRSAAKVASTGFGQSDGNGILGLIDEKTLAVEFHRAQVTLRRWRYLGIGPPYIAFVGGKEVWYRVSAVQAWLASREQEGPAPGPPRGSLSRNIRRQQARAPPR
jgi:hypothetical protein